MGSNIIELAKLGHERAAELKASCGAVNVRSLTQLISDLATQLEVQFVRSTNMAVQLANAESKCRELAAENAGLKAICEDRRTFIMNGVQLGYIKVPTVDTDPALETIRIAVSPQAPTPATDAFLAEVRAQGVGAAIEHLHKKFEGTGHIGVPVMALEWLAQEIRKGASL
ncbi:TPA_asm: eae-like domain protein [Salmonella enterica subsp. enterica serovar Typhimurium]|uniref:Eae-like domain protein n=1 Tax=Salmonella typhimurium TaxID=90371 RepID=A0A8E6JRK2_SALTM|nr:eae-like domain protein [Salmonella enterica]MBL6175104.1 eae-like domain protein [Salmonella enterica subsp. enterica serovar Typhimurium]QVP91814.1 eae-like domain protein [Salmonella enterica subsp. enterica serovar Typhimurium]HAE3813904.1 eae-like domain protein [Salmonella enterica subsp. enterica serovar Typhimurium]HAE8638437.1 eae-like domain protein [Salmonella enterica subsp. enterica serovar Typhimurium]